MSASIEIREGRPVCSNCGGGLDGGFEVLVGTELHTQATVDGKGELQVEDPRGSFDFEWELLEVACPHCGHHISGSQHR